MELAQGDELQRDYVPLILRAMACKKATQRKLAHLTGISKSRLGVLLHSKPEKRVTMTLPEFETILHALGMNLVHAYVCLKTFKGLDEYYQKCYSQGILPRHMGQIGRVDGALCPAIADRLHSR